MTRNPVARDLGIALVIAAVILVIEPGVALAGILALLLLAVVSVSLIIDRLRARRAQRPRYARHPRSSRVARRR